MSFVSSSFNTREINGGNCSFARSLHNSRLWTSTSLTIQEKHQAQKGRTAESEFWVQELGPLLKGSHMWACYSTALHLSTAGKERIQKFCFVHLHGDWRMWRLQELDSRFHDSLMAMLSSRFPKSRCLLPVKLQAKFPLTSEEVGWCQWGSHSFRKLSKYVTNFKNLVWKVLLYVSWLLWE